MEKKPLLSVCMITYNHEMYIGQAIDSVIMQKTKFRIELVIGEDCSTDGTRAVIEEYRERFPDLIRLLPAAKNMGFQRNFVRTLLAAKGTYIALCEGDDYWTDPDKLQQQVDFLQANESYSFVFHNVKIFENGRFAGDVYPVDRKNVVSMVDILRHDYTQTCSIVFRAKMLRTIPPVETTQWIYNDVTLFALILSDGSLGRYFPDVMATYRIHSGGIWSMVNIKKKYNLSKPAEEIIVSKYGRIPHLKNQIAQREVDYYLYFAIEFARTRQLGLMLATSFKFLYWTLKIAPAKAWKLVLPYLHYAKALVFSDTRRPVL